MEPIYIVAIVLGALFVLLLFIYLLSYLKRRNTAREMKEDLDETYSDPNLAKMEYDIAYYDEEIQSRINAMNQKTDEQVTMDELMRSGEHPSDTATPEEDALFAKIDDEGMEEISGNYRPDNRKD